MREHFVKVQDFDKVKINDKRKNHSSDNKRKNLRLSTKSAGTE